MKENTEKIINSLILELDLTENDAFVFLYIVERGKSTIRRMSTDLNIDEESVVSSISTLGDHGMLFNMTALNTKRFILDSRSLTDTDLNVTC